MGDGKSSPEHELTGVPVRRTSPWWHGEQKKGMGIRTLVGTRWRRGSNGRASAKGGGGGGEGRRAASTSWRGGDRGIFYRGREAVVGRGDGRLGSGGAVSRGGRLRNRRRGD
jgi:hypothetical protein